MLNHLPILQVIVPLLAAPSCLIINKARLAWVFAVFASMATWVISVALCLQVTSGGIISYSLGGWDAPWGIEYRIDALNVYVLLIISSISTVVLWAAYDSIQREVEEHRQPFFYVIYLLCLAGLLGMTAAGDVFNVFVFLEISSLATYTLIGMGRDRRALIAAYQYLIVGTIGATFFLVGVGFVYSMTGTLNMQDLAERLPELSSTRTVIAALAFIVVGICLKLALFPLHLWLPNAYAYAPSIAAAFLAASATKVALYLLIRFSYTVFSIEFVFGSLPVSAIFVSLGFMGVFIASLVAIYQSDIKRMFAYSSVAQIGYMIVGFGLGSATGLQAALLHMFNHALMKGALFLALAAVVYRVANPDISSMRGLGRRMPWTMAAIVVGGLSLIGMPLTAGFVSKWYLVLAALEANAWPVAMLVVLGSLLTIAYVWRIVETAYFASDSAPDNAPDSVSGFAPGSVSAARLNKMEAPLSLLIPTWILVLANIYFGIDTRLSVTLSEQAAVYLMGVTP